LHSLRSSFRSVDDGRAATAARLERLAAGVRGATALLCRPGSSASGIPSEIGRPFALPDATGDRAESSRCGIARGARETATFPGGTESSRPILLSFRRFATPAPACSRNGSSRKGTKEPDADRKRCAPFLFGNQGDSRTSQYNFVNLRMISSTHIRKRVSRWKMAGEGFAERGIDRDPGPPYSGTWREDTRRGVGPYFGLQRVYPFPGMARVGRRRLVHSAGGWTDGGGHRFQRTGHIEHGSVKVN
jgi:hypothetical protein